METRATFFARLEPLMSRRNLLKVQLAYTLSKYWHRAQMRKELGPDGKPLRYFEHVRRVALILIDEAKCVRPEMVIAALLHDSIEDTRDEDLSADMIEENFGEDVITIVKILSKVPRDGYITRLSDCSDWRPLLLKACDHLDNRRSLVNPGTSPEFIQKQIRETREHYLDLFNKMITLVPPEHKVKAQDIVYDIHGEVIKAQSALESMRASSPL